MATPHTEPSSTQPLNAQLPGQLAPPVQPDEARSIAKEAYLYAYSIVQNYLSLYEWALDPSGSQYKGPLNQIHNEATVFTPADTGVVTPNSDTPYSFLVMDLRAEPMVVTLPRVEAGRYLSLQLIDLYAHNVDYAGTRVDGNGGVTLLISGPSWRGSRPASITRQVRMPTDLALGLFRTQLFDNADLEAVKEIQRGYKAQPLSSYLGAAAPPAPPTVAYPAVSRDTVQAQFWSLTNFLLQFCPPLKGEDALRSRMRRIGVEGGAPWPPPEMPGAVKAAVAAGQREADAQLEDAVKKLTGSIGLFGSPEAMAGRYLERAEGAMGGLYGNSPEEALYPSYQADEDGNPLDASKNSYVLTFAKGQLPPVDAFWSVTMYDAKTRLLVENPLRRYLINSRMVDDLQRDADGGITLYLQRESPGAGLESNWLPTPAGPLSVVMRLYLPRPEVSRGEWVPPAIRRAGAASVPVTPDNFPRAESDLYFDRVVRNGGFGRFDHTRDPAPLDKQSIIRLNRDTLYSSAVFDLDAGPVTLRLPDAGERFMSLQVFDEDQYTHGVFYRPGAYTLRREEIGTRYTLVAVRTLVNPEDPEDLREVHALQDAIEVTQRDAGRFEIPRWDPKSQKKVRDALLVLASLLPETQRMFGRKEDVDPVRFLIGSAYAWGGNPQSEALYLNVFPSQNDGKTPYQLEVRDVPVDGFWSISVYNSEGLFEQNSLDVYSLNSITAKRDADGAVRVHFGGCDRNKANCLPIMPGWNYMVRLYRPRPEILEGRWHFPEAQAVP